MNNHWRDWFAGSAGTLDTLRLGAPRRIQPLSKSKHLLYSIENCTVNK